MAVTLGEHAETVADVLGHASSATTSEFYLHAIDSRSGAALDAHAALIDGADGAR
jgi:integrase